jgi:transposase
LIDAPFVVDGPMNGGVFLQYVKEILCPSLRQGDCVVADNLASHKIAGVKEAIEATGASIHYLPPYSPDFNPIEKAFSKLKAGLRKSENRTLPALWNDLSSVIDTFSPQDCANYFKSCGYVNT